MRWLAPVLCGWMMMISLAAGAQAPTQLAFRIAFTDKTGSPPLSSAPSFLSSRALQRRASQGIAVDSTDRPVSRDYLDSVLTITSGTLHVTSRWFNQCVILLTDSSQMLLLAGKPYISSTAYVGYFIGGLHNKSAGGKEEELLPAITPSPTAGKGTGGAAYYGQAWGQTDMVHGDYLHDHGFTGAGKLIAVLDAGFINVDAHPMFDSLRNSGRILETKNFNRDTGTVFGYSIHGTAVLSTMAGNWPGQYVGSAPAARYALYITEDNSGEQPVEMDNMVAGIERADSLGVDIVQTSLGYNQFVGDIQFTFPKAELDGHTTLPARAANAATQKGILFVCSAGNEGGNGWNYLLTPSDADSALTVGAVGTGREAWSASSPGFNASGRVKPDVCTQGAPAYVAGYGSSINPSPGTSFATPQLAGYAACLMQSSPAMTPYRIRTAINRSADAYSSPTMKLGYGIPDFRLALAGVSVEDGPGGNIQHALLYPVPAGDFINFRWTAASSGPMTITVLDVAGRAIVAMTVNVSTPGPQLQMVPLTAAVANGMYLIRGVSADGVIAQRFLKD